jgi:hypothetical protein
MDPSFSQTAILDVLMEIKTMASRDTTAKAARGLHRQSRVSKMLRNTRSSVCSVARCQSAACSS